MQITLSEQQLRELKRALDLHIHRLDVELVDTDDRAYREGLKETLTTLEGVRRLLDAPVQATPEAYVSG